MTELNINNLIHHKRKAVFAVVILAVALAFIGISQGIGKNPITIFQEARQWQIAADQTPEEGHAIYGNRSLANLYNKGFSGTSFDSEGTLTTSGEVNMVDIEASPTDENRMLRGVLDITSLDIQTSILDYAVSSSIWAEITTVTLTSPGSLTRFFDIEFEQLTGDALIVYTDNTAGNLRYRTMASDASDWGSEQTLTDASFTGTPRTIVAKRDPDTDDIMVAWEDSNFDIFSALWDGDAFGSVTTHETGSGAIVNIGQVLDIAWEGGISNSEAMLVWGAAVAGILDSVKYNTWTAGSWDTAGTVSEFGNLGGGNKGVEIQLNNHWSDQHSRIAVFGQSGNTKDLLGIIWDGSAWEDLETFTLTGILKGTQSVKPVWQTTTGNLFVPFYHGLDFGTQFKMYYVGTETWSAAWQIDDVGTALWKGGGVDADADPNSQAIAVIVGDKNNVDGTFGIICADPCTTGAAEEWTTTELNTAESDDGGGLSVGIAYFDGSFVAYELTQNNWRWYENINAVDPTTPYGGAGQKEAITGVPCGEVLRIRMNISVAIEDMVAGSEAFKLQYGQGTDCTTISEENWHDVGAKSSGTIWRGYENAISDPQTITTLKLVDPGGSEAKESYSEENPSPKNPNAISSGQEGEWDWVIQEWGATANTSYCFRMIYSDGDELYAYNTDSYPKLTTGEPYVKQLHYRWRDNDGGE